MKYPQTYGQLAIMAHKELITDMKKNDKLKPTREQVHSWAFKNQWIIGDDRDYNMAKEELKKEIRANAKPLITKSKRGPKGPRTMESLAISTMKKGSIFFTSKSDREITGLASIHGVRVKTSRLFTIDKDGKTEKIVKVHIL